MNLLLVLGIRPRFLDQVVRDAVPQCHESFEPLFKKNQEKTETPQKNNKSQNKTTQKTKKPKAKYISSKVDRKFCKNRNFRNRTKKKLKKLKKNSEKGEHSDKKPKKPRQKSETN